MVTQGFTGAVEGNRTQRGGGGHFLGSSPAATVRWVRVLSSVLGV